MDPIKNNTFEMDIRSPLREINLQNNMTPEQNNSPNKSVNLLDATTTSFENSILMPATDPENTNTLDVTSTNRENQRPRYSILGTFDPIYQKKESDSSYGDLQSLIDETITKQPISEVIDEPLQRNNETTDVASFFVNECVNKALEGLEKPITPPENVLNNTIVLSADHQEKKTDSSIYEDLQNLIDETFTKPPVSTVIDEPLHENTDVFVSECVKGSEKLLITPENELNKSSNSNVSSVSDASELNNTVILSKTFAENKQNNTSADYRNNNPDKSFSDSVICAKEELPIKVIPQLRLKETTSGSDLSDSFLEKFTRATVISTPPSKNTTREPENVLDSTYSKEDLDETDEKVAESSLVESPQKQSEEVDVQDPDSIDLENPISQYEDFDSDSLNDEIESAQNEILHELSVESSKIVSELNKTQESFKGDETLISESDKNKSFEIIIKEELQPVKLEQKEQIIQEINVTYSEPESPNLIEKNKSQRFEGNEQVSQEINLSKIGVISPQKVENFEPKSPNKSTSFEISFKEEQSIPGVQDIKAKTTEPKSPNKSTSFEISFKEEQPIQVQEIKANEPKSPNKNISYEIIIKEDPIEKVNNQPVVPEVKELIPQEIEPKNSEPISPNKVAHQEEIQTDILDINTPVKSIEKNISKTAHVVDFAETEVNKNISFGIESSLIVKEVQESSKKLSEDIGVKLFEELSQVSSIISSSPAIKTLQGIDPVEVETVNKNISFVIESSPIAKIKPESPQKLCEVSSEFAHVLDPVNKNISFVIESSPIAKIKPETPQKLCEDIEIDQQISKVLSESAHILDPVTKNISFVIESSPILKTKPESPQKITETPKHETVESKQVSSDEIIVETPQKVEIHPIEDILATPIVESVIPDLSELKDKHMSEAKPIEKSEVCESAVTNSAPTNEMGEVINQNDCFQKQSDITNGAVDNKETLDAKNEMYNEMVERLSLLESECEKYKIQVAELKRELKTCRQKSISLGSEVADLKRKENELNILLDEFKNKKPEITDADGKDEELKLLRASEEALKNEAIELKVLVKQHENKLKELQQKEVKLADDLSSKTQSELQISRVMEEYEKSISSLVAENEKMKKERDTAQMHLSNIELAFSDVHQKYERCKRVVQGYKGNEESYRQDIAMNRETIATQEQKYATLKAHAMAQLEKSNQELLGIKKQHETEMARLTAQLKRYEIKNDSLMEALQQKTKECEQLSVVCDELIGKV